MKRKRTGWIWLVIIVAVLAAAGLLLPRLMRIGSVNENAQQYEAAKATRGDMRVTVHGTGSIEAMDTKTVTPAASGRVESVLVENGDAVKKGDLIAVLDDEAALDKIDSLKDQIAAQDAAIARLRAMPSMKILYAPVECRVKAIYAKKEQDVNVSMSAYGAIMLLSTDGRMKVRFMPAAGVEIMAGVAVTFDIGGKKASGFISSAPDATTSEAEALVLGDTYALGAHAEILNTGGARLGDGSLEVNKPLYITANSGTVNYIYVKYNEKLKARHKLVKLDGAILDPNFDSQLLKRQQLQDDLDRANGDLADLRITAPADGVVTGIALQEGGMAQEGMQACTIQEVAGFKLVVAVDELDIPGIKIGQKADVKIDALPDAPASGEVARISPVGLKANDVTTYDVTLNVAAPDGALAGMSASADIETAFKADALLVPVEAIHTVDGKTWVYKALPADLRPTASPGPSAAGNGSGRFGFPGMFGNRGGNTDTDVERPVVEVTVGLVSDSWAEILSGLGEGDEVAVPVAQNSLEMMFGGFRNQSGQNYQGDSKATGD